MRRGGGGAFGGRCLGCFFVVKTPCYFISGFAGLCFVGEKNYNCVCFFPVFFQCFGLFLGNVWLFFLELFCGCQQRVFHFSVGRFLGLFWGSGSFVCEMGSKPGFFNVDEELSLKQ